MKSRIFDGLDGLNQRIRPNFGIYLVWLFHWFVTSWPCLAGDWPMYRHDAQRSATTTEQLALPLKLAWSYPCAQPPAPAWPDSFRLLNRMDFDYAPQLAIAEGIICFGSSADDTVRALDAKTGREKWHFITGGPVRFAPQIVSNRVYFSSDDGYVYCLNAQNGRGIWKFNLAPADERFIGNHRMISRWPVRTGVLVDSGVVYAVAGMWPAEGIFAYALAADTGRIIWCNDTLGGTPQGALLLGGDVLLVPNGNAKTTPLDRRTGKPMQWPAPPGASGVAHGWLAGQYANFAADPRAGKPAERRYLGGSAGRGGTWVTLDGDNEYTFAMHRSGVLAIEPYSLTNGLVTGRAWGSGVVPQLHELSKVSAIVHQGKPYARKAYGLALAGNMLFLGHDGAVTAESTEKAGTNKISVATAPWQAKVDGEAREIAVADGRLFVSTSEGVIYCFAPAGEKTEFRRQNSGGRSQEAKSGSADSNQSPSLGGSASGGKIENRKSKIALLLQQAGMDRGFALVLGDTDGQMSMDLAAQTQLRVINALTNEAAAKALREKLLAQTAWHGSRIHVQHVARLDALPFAQYFANAVIVAADEAGRDPDSKRSGRPSREGRWPVPTGLTSTNGIVTGGPRSVVAGMGGPGLSGQELYRVLRPCGGILLLPGMEKAAAEALILECDAYEAASHARSVQVATEPTPPSGHPSKEGSLTNDPLQRRGGPDASLPQESRDDRDRGGFPFFVRGKLSGALDWDQEPGGIFRVRRGADQRVKWPLRLLWFGGPTTRQAQNDVEGADGPVPANGRYFMVGERTLTAVDAYNGALLWSRPMPEAWPGIRERHGVLYRVSESAIGGRPDRSRRVLVNNEGAFLVLGPEYFQGKGKGTIQLDAQTGEQRKVFGPFNAPTSILLQAAQTWPLEANSNQSRASRDQSALVAMEATAHGLVLTLTTQDPSVTPLDAWELYFDFRPVDERYGLYDRGVFHIRVTPARDPAGGGTGPASGGVGAATPATWSPITAWSSYNSVGRHSMTAPSVAAPMDIGAGSVSGSSATAGGATPLYPQIEVSGTHDANGTKTLVNLPWTEIQKLIGAKPSDFDFAATLEAHNGGRDEPIVRRHLFGDWTSDGINNGWARIVLDKAAAATLGTNLPAIMGSGAPGGSYGPRGYGQNLHPSVLESPGTHPLTGEPVPKVYGIAPVCGADYASAYIISQAGGLYDLTENSGRHPCYPGVKTGCTTFQIAVLGLFLISEEWGHCVCNYPFRGSLALAPAERRLNEDWAHFYDRDVDTRVRQAYVNLGVGGDRRDEKGNLWLGFPRNNELRTPEDSPNPDHPLPYPLGMRDAQTGLWHRRPIRSAVWVPLDVETMTNFGPYRFNTDRVTIKGTDRPWIYGSGYRGIRKATLKLDFFKPLVSLPASTVDKPDGRDGARPSTAAAAAITVDGKLDETLWTDELRATSSAPLLPYTLTRVVFRHDSQALYVGLSRPPMTVVKRLPRVGSTAGFTNEPRPWQATTNSAPDKISSGDNQWRLIVSPVFAQGATPGKPDQGIRSAHFVMTPTGVRAEALYAPVKAVVGPAGSGAGAMTNALDWTWNPAWQSAVQTNELGWTLEMAIPWQTLAAVGVQPGQLAVNFLMSDPGGGTEALTYLGMGGADHCSNFTPLGLGAPAAIPPRQFTVRLHFAEPDENSKPGQRVFDVLLQGRLVLTGFDIVKEAGGARKALLKEFPHVPAAEALTVEFKPCAAVPDSATAPILSGLELVDETWERPKM